MVLPPFGSACVRVLGSQLLSAVWYKAALTSPRRKDQGETATRNLRSKVMHFAVWILLNLPGFKGSSQHLERRGCDDRLEAAFGSVRARRLALAGSAFCCAA